MEELLEKNKRLLLENAELLEKLAQRDKDLKDMDAIIRERNFWFSVVSDIWERSNKAMVRRE